MSGSLFLFACLRVTEQLKINSRSSPARHPKFPASESVLWATNFCDRGEEREEEEKEREGRREKEREEEEGEEGLSPVATPGESHANRARLTRNGVFANFRRVWFKKVNKSCSA